MTSVTPPIDTVHAFVDPPSVLAEGEPGGPLFGTTVAVKDVIDVAGMVTGAGNPAFAAGRAPAPAHASTVAALVRAGCTVVGKTITDELAYSLSGTNIHYGTPLNSAAPDREPGGSSAGSVAAVAAGLVDLGLGTDTGGSIRVPASYCGVVGWRPTHGAVPTEGVVHLARSFDTVGLLATDIGRLAIAAAALLGPTEPAPPVTEAVVIAEALAVVGPAVHDSVLAAAAAPVEPVGVDLELGAQAFRWLQGREAWQEHGEFVASGRAGLGPGIAARFAAASQVTDDEVAEGEALRAEIRRVLDAATAGGRVLLGPAAAGAAPRLDLTPEQRATIRAGTLQLTCLAGLAGLPVVVVPVADDGGLPVGLACMGARGSDLALLEWATARFAE